MAKEDERPSAADKGKGKAEDSRELNGDKKDSKEKKPLANGKKDEVPQEGMDGTLPPSSGKGILPSITKLTIRI
jgi:hypothetical protein